MSQTHRLNNREARFRAVETMHPEDCHLVKRAQAGETDAFRTLVERHQQTIYNLCYRMLKHTEDAKDATHTDS